jgi:hypothetical protein
MPTILSAASVSLCSAAIASGYTCIHVHCYGDTLRTLHERLVVNTGPHSGAGRHLRCAAGAVGTPGNLLAFLHTRVEP